MPEEKNIYNYLNLKKNILPLGVQGQLLSGKCKKKNASGAVGWQNSNGRR
jgi:hypothetical protein